MDAALIAEIGAALVQLPHAPQNPRGAVTPVLENRGNERDDSTAEGPRRRRGGAVPPGTNRLRRAHRATRPLASEAPFPQSRDDRIGAGTLTRRRFTAAPDVIARRDVSRGRREDVSEVGFEARTERM
jgi:hypothetical protein